jgi:predicted aspartyl protease
MTAEVGLGEIEWLGKLRTVELIGSKGNDALIGTELLESTALNIDYIASTVRITTSVAST